MSTQPETKAIFIVYTNTDLTEGRGHQVPIAYAAGEATARRLAKGKGVQGSDAQVEEFEAIKHRNQWCAPFTLQQPTKADEKQEQLLAERRDALARARAAGLSDDDLRALGVKP